MVIFAVVGLKRSGKDTISNYLNTKYKYEKLAFADPLKKMVNDLFHISTDPKLKETPDEKWGVSPRQLYQFFGTEIFRKKLNELIPTVGENFWVMKMEEKIKQLKQKYKKDNIVISDLRFPNEHIMLKRLNVIVIKVVRKDLKYEKDLHESESYDIDAKYVIENNSTKDQLFLKVDKILEKEAGTITKEIGSSILDSHKSILMNIIDS